jgi:hypothetical protein
MNISACTNKKLADEAPFAAWDLIMNGENKIVLQLNKNTSVPNVTYFVELLVKFRCNEGSLEQGNEIITVSRR